MSSDNEEETNRPYFKDIPIIKFPEYVQRNDYYMLTEDISYFLGGIIPASDVETLFEEFRTIFPKKIKHEQQEFIVFQEKKDKRKRKVFNNVKDTLLKFQQNGNAPNSVIEATRNSNRLCFLNAERVHQMFLNALVETESELLVSFILMRSILDEKIIKSPFKSSIGIRADFPSMEKKKDGNVDIVFPPEFKHTKHSVWSIKKKRAKDSEKNKSKSDSSEKKDKPAASSSSSEPPSNTTENQENKGKNNQEQYTFLPSPKSSESAKIQLSPLGGFEMDSQIGEPSTKQQPPPLSVSSSNSQNQIVPELSHSLISIGSSVRILYSIDVTNVNSINLTVSVKEYDEAIKSTEKQTRALLLSNNRIRDVWILEYGFGLSYSGGIVGIPSSHFFNSGLSIVLDTNLRLILDQIRDKSRSCIIPFSESILKKGVKTPQQLAKLAEEIVTNSSDGEPQSTTTTSNLSIITTNRPTNNCLPPLSVNNNLESLIHSSTVQLSSSQPNLPNNIEWNDKPRTNSKQSQDLKQTTSQPFSLPDDGRIDLNQCDIGWEETNSSDPTNEEDNYSDSHSTCYDDDESLFIMKRKIIDDDLNSSEENVAKKTKTADEEELEEPHQVTILKRLLQFNLITDEDFQIKLKLFQAIEKYRDGSFQYLQEIISSQLETLNDFSEKENLICPLTKKFILDPVLAPDGLLYDRTALSHWITTFSSLSLLGGCKVTSFTNIPSAVEEVNKILSQRVEKGIEFVEQIVDQFSIYCADLLPFIDQLVYYDTLNKNRRKLMEHKLNIIDHNIATIPNGHNIYFECGKEIVEMETDKNRKIQLSVSMLNKNPNPDYYSYFSNIIYQCCNQSIDELKLIPNITPKMVNNILTVLLIKGDIRTFQFLTSLDVKVSSEPTANQWFNMLLLLSHKEAESLSHK